MSQSFNPAQANYDTHDKELLAIIHVLEHWRLYLEYTKEPITVYMDHQNLEYWKSARIFGRRHARWYQQVTKAQPYAANAQPRTVRRKKCCAVRHSLSQPKGYVAAR